MSGERLELGEVQAMLDAWPPELRQRALEARALVLELAPQLDETIAFRALCYARRDAPYGVIGGNVCLVDVKHGQLFVSFLHGASLPDPARLLRGKAKAKRNLPIASAADRRHPAITDLILAAVAYDPSAS